MYASNVINSLFFYGIGSIPLSASLSIQQEKNVRNLLKLNNFEIIILFIGVGNFFEDNQITMSHRKEIQVKTL